MSTFPKLKALKLKPLTAWSYKRYSDYKRCPMFFAYVHLAGIKEEFKGPAATRGIEVHEAGANYLTAKGKPKLPDEYKYFADEMTQLRTMNPIVEQQWGFTKDWTPTGWFGGDVWVRGVTDICVVYDDNTALVVDNKTGKKYATNEEQMRLFGLLTFKKFPNLVEVSTRLWYLDIPVDNEVERIFTIDEVPAMQRDWEKAVRPMFNDQKFPPRPNEKCRWCFLSKAKGGPCQY